MPAQNAVDLSSSVRFWALDDHRGEAEVDDHQREAREDERLGSEPDLERAQEAGDDDRRPEGEQLDGALGDRHPSDTLDYEVVKLGAPFFLVAQAAPAMRPDLVERLRNGWRPNIGQQCRDG